MIDVQDVQEKISDTNEMIARVERLLAAHPGDKSLALNLSSFQKRRRQLQAEMAQGACDSDQERTDQP